MRQRPKQGSSPSEEGLPHLHRQFMHASKQRMQKIRLLIAIASYGEKNLDLLKKIIEKYRSMPLQIDVVVVSEAPKDLRPGVKVIAGLPSKNPWSLPFAHKAVFAQEVDNYDLFLYSEDDIQYSERNFAAFLEASEELAPDEVAGFLLYERDKEQTVWLTSIYGHWHWDPESVRQRGRYIVAEFSNQHSASYLLTRAQLKRAIASGGFLRAPYEHRGLYDMLCTAATDPYTSCGLRKVIGISAIDDFLIHHTPNRYTDFSRQNLSDLNLQVQAMLDIGAGRHPAKSLFEIQPKFWHFWWQKSYYEDADPATLNCVPLDAKRILTIGCGWGATEAKLREKGAAVTAMPLDSIIGAAAARHQVEIIYGRWDECCKALDGRKFDCVLIADLLHLHPSPGQVAAQAAQFVADRGSLVIRGPNFDRLPWRIKRVLGKEPFAKLRDFTAGGISLYGPRSLKHQLGKAGLRVNQVQWLNHLLGRGRWRGKQVNLGSLTARDWLVQASR
jgi:2-polyprenyl-3-methyl-5-hydroxy-6-metoxy-1,4-benzoquinol methylase